MIRKIVIAAAGQGTRMLHITKNKSKHLIKVNKKPFLSYLLDHILKAGLRDIILVVGYREEEMRKFLKDYGYKAILVNQFDILGDKDKIYGTACPLMCVEDIIKKENFLFVCGDNFYSVRDFKEMMVDDKYNYIAALEHKNPYKYGVLIHKEDFLEKIVEKPKEFLGNLINAGLYKFTPDVFKKIKKIYKSPRGEYEITDVINLLAKEKKVKIKKINDYWLDFGNPGDIIKFSKFIKNLKNEN